MLGLSVQACSDGMQSSSSCANLPAATWIHVLSQIAVVPGSRRNLSLHKCLALCAEATSPSSVLHPIACRTIPTSSSRSCFVVHFVLVIDLPELIYMLERFIAES